MRSIFARLFWLGLVALVVPACGGSSGSGGTADSWLANGGSFIAYSSGGQATVGAGGAGGDFTAQNFSADNLYVLAKGSVNTKFSVPTGNLSLGSNPRTIVANITLSVGAGLTEGSATILGDDGVNTATGLIVPPGITLTLRPNFPGGAVLRTSTQLTFNDGASIQGVIAMGRRDDVAPDDGLSIHAADLVLTAVGGVVCGPNSAILASGTFVGPTAGGNGGSVTLAAAGAIVNTGTVVTSGANGGTTGGNGGNVQMLSTLWEVINTGNFTTRGGNGAAGTGGNGGAVSLQPSTAAGSFTGGGAFNSGFLFASGGDGTDGGGKGGAISIGGSSQDGPVVNSGDLLSRGGKCTGDGSGGAGGAVSIEANGGQGRVSGSVTTSGGDGAGLGDGGAGGAVTVYRQTNTQTSLVRGLYVGCIIWTYGGSGASGGPGGDILVRNDEIGAAVNPTGDVYSPLYVVGLNSVTASGGGGRAMGGNAGNVAILQAYGYNTPAYSTFGRGSLFNEVTVSAVGGQASVGTGGMGATVNIGWLLGLTYGFSAPQSTMNTAIVDATGGSGAASGGSSGGIFIIDPLGVSNSGMLQSDGGFSGTGAGGAAGMIQVRSDDVTTNNALLSALGGRSAAAGTGGTGGPVLVEGRVTTTTGDLVAGGGTSATGLGGNGANIEIGSWDGVTLTKAKGTFTVQGGPGVTAGATGIITIDGIRIALLGGSVTY